MDTSGTLIKMGKLKRLLIISCLVVLVAVIAVMAINIYMILYARRYIVAADEAAGKADAVIVPGAYVFPTGEVSWMLGDRLDTALEAYGTVSDNILVSGDHGKKDYDEVRAMKNYLLSRDVPEDDIFMDHAGFSTYDTMYRARDVFAIKKALICTQTYHLYRALYIARKLGIEAYGMSADLHEYPGMIYYGFREVFARVKDFFYVMFDVKPVFLGPVIDIRGSGLLTED
jgi:SanA protein